MTIPYESLLLNYNFIGGAGKSSTDITSDSRDNAFISGGRYNIGYYLISSPNDVSSTGYYSTIPVNSYLHEGTGALDSGQANAINQITAASGVYDVLFSNVAKVNLFSTSFINANIIIGQTFANDGGTLFFSDDDTPQGNAGFTFTADAVDFISALGFGDIWINNDYDTNRENKDSTDPISGTLWPTSISSGSNHYLALMHELGHALGLDEMRNASAALGQQFLDNQKYSIMSYNAIDGMGDANSNVIVAPKGLQLLDIAAIQAIYGADFSTRAGHTTYDKNAAFTSSQPHDAFIYTIWDGGGVDEIDASGYANSAKIDLRQGEFSSVGNRADGSNAFFWTIDINGHTFSESGGNNYTTDNLAVAYNTIIENAKGTSAADLLIGNAWNNTIYGGGGRDFIYGDGSVYDGNVGYGAYENQHKPESGAKPSTNYSGDDVLIGEGGDDHIFGGNGSDTLDGGDGADVLEGGGGNDTLIGGAGNDIIDFGAGGAVAGGDLGLGGAGDDIYRIPGLSSNYRIDDTEGANVLYVGQILTPQDIALISSNESQTAVRIGGAKVVIANLPSALTGGSGSGGGGGGVSGSTPTPPKPGVSKIVDAAGTVFEVPTESTEDPAPPPVIIKPIFDGFRDYMDNDIANEGSPLVLDLDGDGVEVSAFGQSGQVYWDIDQDGFGEASSWVMPDDGLLAFDRNGNGYIDDSNELFGTLTTDGFSVLSVMDTNSDGQITSSDANFSRLRVWQDINSDGFSQTNELRSLTQVGITAIDLNATETNTSINGNQVSHVSSFTMNGGTHEIADVWFNFDQMNSVYQGAQNLTDEVAVLPELRGYGDIMNLRTAMAQDSTLQTMVQSLADMSVDELFDPAEGVISLVNDIMFRWAGVDGMDPNGRGMFIGDARVLEFLEAMTGKDFYQRGYSDPMEVGSQKLRATFGDVQGVIFTHLLTQVAGKQIFSESGQYNSETDNLDGNFQIDFGAIEGILERVPVTGNELSLQWITILTVIKFTIGFENLSPDDLLAFDELIHNSTAGVYDFDELVRIRDAFFGINRITTLTDENNDQLIYGTDANEAIFAGYQADEVHGNGGNDEIYGGSGNDDLFGESGADTIHGEDGADTLTGGEGNDYLVGGAGNDTYVYTSGVDVIEEAQGNDEIVLPTGIFLSDMRLEYADEAQTGLDIYLNEVLSIRLQNWYDPNGKVERIVFADNTVFNLIGAFTDTTDGTPNDDILTGHDHSYQPNDEIWGQGGNDSLTGGQGDDLLYGESGDDTYFVGSGVDTIYEEGSDTGDTIRFGAGVGAGDLRFETDADGFDLFIYVSDVLKARVVGQFSGAGSVEYISLNGVSTINLLTTVTTQVGSATEDYLVGIEQGGPNSNIINAMAGNDIVMAGDGDDVINGGAGDDTLNGGTDNDSYVYDLSYNAGFDTVIDIGGTADVISVNTSLASANLSFSRNEVNNLIVNLGGQQAMLLAGFFQTQGRIESIVFTDQTLSLNSIVNILGTSANETLNGDASTLFGDDLIFGYGGNDTLNGLTGNDVLYGGDGSDTINGGDGNDTLFGDAGADTLDGGAGDDVMEGGAAADTYLYSAGSDTIREIANGGGVNDILKFGSGITLSNLTFVRDLALDYTGNNLWVNQGSNSTLIEGQFGSTGIETLLFADNSSTSLTGVRVQTQGSAFGDTIYGLIGYSETINGGDGTDEIYADDGNDILFGGGGTDALYGGTGNDILDGEADVDTLDGQAGHDVYYVGAGDVVLESGNNDNDLYLIAAAVTGSYSITDYGGGNDALYITLLAGQSYTFTSDGSSLSINLISGSDTATITITSQYGALPESIVERIIFGSFAGNVNTYDGTYTHTGGFVMTENGLSQTVTYTAAAETINGSTSTLVSDNINAAGGNDIVYGFAGADYVYAGDGNDYVYGGDDNDTLFGEAGDDVLGGDAGDDILWGGAGVDYLWGNTGNDTLYGEAGADALRGMEGDDIIWGGDDNDNIRGDDVDSASNFSGAGNDELHGGNGNDNMAGGAGDDVLYGDAGQDTLWGNAGADTFKFDTSSNAMDYVMDYNWQSEVDIIDISGVFNESYSVDTDIASFVQLQALSAHTRIQVDRDGSGSAFGWENLAQLQNKTGLDLGTLVSNGALIVD